jgi:hypothetical protein
LPFGAEQCIRFLNVIAFCANDWVYYSTGGYTGVFDVLGEYYRPCLAYPSNALWEYNPFADSNVKKAIIAWSELGSMLRAMPINGMPSKIKRFIRSKISVGFRPIFT